MMQNKLNVESTLHLNMVMFLLDQSLSFTCTRDMLKWQQGMEIYGFVQGAHAVVSRRVISH